MTATCDVPLRTAAPLWSRDFQLYFTARLVSLLGDAMLPVALLYGVVELGYGTTGVGLVLAAQMVPFVILYAPLAAYLVEAFPANIRYTSISLPYKLGNGWFGGFVPLIATALVARTGNAFAWLAYPIAIALVTVVVGARYVTESSARKLWAEVA